MKLFVTSIEFQVLVQAVNVRFVRKHTQVRMKNMIECNCGFDGVCWGEIGRLLNQIKGQ